LVALWKSGKRSILVSDTESIDQDTHKLEALEQFILDTNKFSSHCEYLTCLTYSKGDSGTITLFSVGMSSSPNEKVRNIRPFAGMDNVPKAILRGIGSDIPGSQRVIVRLKHDRPRWRMPDFMLKERYRHRRHDSRGEMGDALKDALLGVRRETCHSVSITVPQLLGWLHLKSPILEDVETGEVRQIQYGSETRRTVKWERGPKLAGYGRGNSRAIVLMPARDAWMEERILWR